MRPSPFVAGCCWLQGPVEQNSCAIPPFFLSCPPLCVSLCVSDPTPHPPPTWSLPSCRHSSPKPPSHPMLGTKSAHCQPDDCLDRPACQPVCLLHHRDMDSVSVHFLHHMGCVRAFTRELFICHTCKSKISCWGNDSKYVAIKTVASVFLLRKENLFFSCILFVQ